MSGTERMVIAWSAASAVWWGIALVLVNATRQVPTTPQVPPTAPIPSLTLFKSLPAVPDEETRDTLASAVGSFIAQMNASTEMRVGVPVEQRTLWQPVLNAWGEQFPAAKIRAVFHETPRQRANPKVAWLELLAPDATGEVWLWSDADIRAPEGFLEDLRRELLLHPTAGAVTAPYGIRSTAHAAGWWDALFVNMEFLPGALLLGRIGPVPLAFGAAVLFRAADFQRRVSWDSLGSSLADDHELGRSLAPVVVSRRVAETCALETRLLPALRHVYRWQKTIRWCRPAGFAALIAILPLLGWVTRCAMAPSDARAWIGLVGQYTFECGVAAALLNRVGFRGPPAGWLALLAWPASRTLVWLAAWLPIPVRWGDSQTWERPNH